MVTLALGSLALAAPQFVAVDPGDVAVAREAWSAAIECTGWEAAHKPQVPIERGYVPGGYLGRAFHDGGLSLIELSADDGRVDEVIVHEVAHAWVSDGPTALAEGRAELLADCMVRHRPGLAPLQWDDGRELSAMPDLKTWSTAQGDGPAIHGDARTDAYLGAARLVRTAASLTEPRAFWLPEGMDWAGFRALLTPVEGGPALLEVLDSDVGAQRASLSDHDRDGLTAISEALTGTDPAAWDSDGDGWWDGAKAPAGAVPVPLDGSPVCLGVAAGSEPTVARVVTGGDLRGAARPRIRPIGVLDSDHAILLTPGQPLVVRGAVDSPDVSGGVWAAPAGDLVASQACHTGAVATVWSATGTHPERVAQLLPQIEATAQRAAMAWGPVPGRVSVALGGSTSTIRDGVVFLSDADLEDPEGAARLAVAVHRAWAIGQPDWRAARGVARMLARL
jgi:hypothetical protein